MYVFVSTIIKESEFIYIYNDRAPDGELTELPAQKGMLRISDREKAIQPSYLYDPNKDDREITDYTETDPPQPCNDPFGPRPY